MNFTAVVFAEDDTPLVSGGVVLVIPEGDKVAVMGRGAIAEGELRLTSDAPGPIWGLLIDGRPVLAVAAAMKGDTVDLGEINLLREGVACPAFHAPDGRIFGVPFIDQPRTALPTQPGDETPPTRPPLDEAPTNGDTIPREPVLRTGLTFSGLVGSTAQQLGAVTALKQGFKLTGANVRVKGVPTVSNEAIGLDFPDAVLAATGAGLSEISFTMRPPVEDPLPTNGDGQPQPPSGPPVPNVIGYSSELATRKLAAVKLLSDVSSVIVTDAAQEGRIVRQVPAPGITAAEGAVVRLFVGKRGGV